MSEKQEYNRRNRCVIVPYIPPMITPLRSDDKGNLWIICPEDKNSQLARIEPDSVSYPASLYCSNCEKEVEINLTDQGGAIDKITKPDVN